MGSVMISFRPLLYNNIISWTNSVNVVLEFIVAFNVFTVVFVIFIVAYLL